MRYKIAFFLFVTFPMKSNQKSFATDMNEEIAREQYCAFLDSARYRD